MANERRGNFFKLIQQNFVAFAMVIVVFLLFIPIPKVLIDVSMILNLAFSIIILLVVISIPRPSDFQAFPRVVLFQTLFSLGINISSTRLILMGGSKSGNDQSEMVKAFARIVAGDDIVIGLIIFIIIIVVQVLVITKGSGRVSEVAARFSLDSMSSKFFDINDRLGSGAITQDEAEELKAQLRREIDFYSNMDGSSKFVSGNVKAGIFITIINLLGGFVIGMVRNNMDFVTALNTYSNLTIGDGLTSQLPSLIISFATGILVTGTKNDETLGEQIKDEFTFDGHIYEIVGVVLIISGLILRHNTQFYLIPIGALFIFIGFRLVKQNSTKKQREKQTAEEEQTKNASNAHTDDKIQELEKLSLELGYGLVPLVDEEKGAELVSRIKKMRTQCIYDMGFKIPNIRILDNSILEPDEYSFKIEGIEVGRANLRVGYVMCMDAGNVLERLEGEKTKDPAFGMDAIWLPESRKSEAETAGYVVVDPTTVLSTHLTEIIRSNAAKILDREAVSEILNEVKNKQPVLVDEVLNTAKISYGAIQKVFQNLLEEKVSIRNYSRILETMANYYSISQNTWDLTQKVRETLGLQICMQYVEPNEKKLRVLRLSQEFTEMISEHAFYPNDGSKPQVALDPVDRRRWLNAVSSGLAKASQFGYYPIILCVSQIRQLVKSSIEVEQPGVVVLSDMEVMAARGEIAVEVIDDISDVSEVNSEISGL